MTMPLSVPDADGIATGECFDGKWKEAKTDGP